VALDALLKKHFTLVVLGLIALAAYLQASGATHLMGAAIGSSSAASTPSELSPVAYGVPGRTPPSAEPIIERNPFDSVTGSLNKKEEVEGATPEQKLDLSDPLGAPRCDGVQVFILTESDDPAWSLAALQGPGEPHPKLRRQGDPVGDKEIAYIGYNPREMSPSVWLTSGSLLCQVLMFASAQPAAPPAAQAVAEVKAPPQAAAAGGSGLPAEIASRIQKVSETEYNVDRAVVDKILESQAELMKTARIVPEQKDGKVVGIRLFGIRPNTLLGSLGFQNGDRLETINGFDMSSPEKALEAYARLRTASNLNVKVNRRGNPLSIDYRIK
jgi:general secretion pathway protein C